MSVVPLPGPPPGERAEVPPLRWLEARAHAFAEAAARVAARADDEAVHDLRVRARRLESALEVWRDALARRPARRARRRIAGLRRAAGPVRELEVHAAALAALQPGPEPDAREAVDHERERLARRLARARRRLAAVVTPERVERIRRRVERAAQAMADSPPAAAHAAARADRRVARGADALAAATGTSDDRRLHAARLAIKKWRYAEEAVAALGHPRPGSDAARLKSLQSALGRIHDLATLRGALVRAAARAERRGEPSRAAALTRLAARLERERLEAVTRFQRRRERAATPPA